VTRYALALPLLLAACGPEPAAENARDSVPLPSAAPFSNLQQQVIDLPDGQRNGMLLRAILDGGQNCQGVKEAVRHDRKGVPTWEVRCADGGMFIISVGPGGIAQVTGASAPKRLPGL
jgi:hypothetical protein